MQFSLDTRDLRPTTEYVKEGNTMEKEVTAVSVPRFAERTVNTQIKSIPRKVNRIVQTLLLLKTDE